MTSYIVQVNDKVKFQVSQDFIRMSSTLTYLVEDIKNVDEAIPLTDIDSTSFELILKIASEYTEEYKKFVEAGHAGDYMFFDKRQPEDEDELEKYQLKDTKTTDDFNDDDEENLEKKCIIFSQDKYQTIENLYSLLMGANFLDIKWLLNASARTIASLLKGKTTQQMRDILHVQNDFTPEEEAEARKPHEWIITDKE